MFLGYIIIGTVLALDSGQVSYTRRFDLKCAQIAFIYLKVHSVHDQQGLVGNITSQPYGTMPFIENSEVQLFRKLM